MEAWGEGSGGWGPLSPHGWWFHWQFLGYCASFLLGYLSPALPLLPGWGVPLLGSEWAVGPKQLTRVSVHTWTPVLARLGGTSYRGKPVHSLGSLTLCSVLAGEADHPHGGVIPA